VLYGQLPIVLRGGEVRAIADRHCQSGGYGALINRTFTRTPAPDDRSGLPVPWSLARSSLENAGEIRPKGRRLGKDEGLGSVGAFGEACYGHLRANVKLPCSERRLSHCWLL